MRPIHHEGVHRADGGWAVRCACGIEYKKTLKDTALKILRRGCCRKCMTDHRNLDCPEGIWNRSDGKWCKRCSGCGVEQAYTRKAHAVSSLQSDWKCRACCAKTKGYPVGPKMRLYNKFSKSAASRGIEWHITPEQMFESFEGRCAMTGWEISLDYGNTTASLDRIDSDKGYTPGNIQWVHSMVNMAKNRYSQERFVEMCKAVANNNERNEEPK